MEELKLLVSMVADLPDMALWVIGFFFVYKMFIIGSVYSVIRLALVKTHGWAVSPAEYTFHGKYIRDGLDVRVNKALANFLVDGQFKYIHESDVMRLEAALLRRPEHG